MKVASEFRSAWWLRNAHLHTVWCSVVRRPVRIDCAAERLELPDGDFVDLAWLDRHPAAPLVVAFHGLAGSVESQHMAGVMRALDASGYGSVLMHFRGCSGVPNRLRRAYHSGETGDINYLLEELRRRFPTRTLYAFGVSLGANALLKYLGEVGSDVVLDKAVAVSPPFQLSVCSDHMNKGLARFYQRYLVARLVKAAASKTAPLDGPPVDSGVLDGCRSFWEFDEHVTAPLHGFSSASDYYQRSSSRQFLAGIEVPTLIVHSRDDPFFVPDVIPGADELSSSVRLEVSRHGGHVGFRGPGLPGRGRYWLEERLPRWFKEGR
ncbi:MAG: putative alpha/beta-fold hydrolase [Kiritimatiellia bacterium]|jgi:predicted alpha/beta-fold hydrolase